MFSSFGTNTKPILWLYFSAYDVEGGFTARLGGMPEIRHGEVWRLFTPMFVHFGLPHLFFNILWLLDLGTMIERRQSTARLALLVLVIAALSNFGQYLIGGPGFGGMSGVVYGLLGYAWMKGKFDPASGLFVHPQTMLMMLVWLFLCMTPLLAALFNIQIPEPSTLVLLAAGLGGIGGGVEPVRATLLLKIGDLVVGQLDLVFALPRLQRVRLGRSFTSSLCRRFGARRMR